MTAASSTSHPDLDDYICPNSSLSFHHDSQLSPAHTQPQTQLSIRQHQHTATPNATAIAEALQLLSTHPNISVSVRYDNPRPFADPISSQHLPPTAHYNQLPLHSSANLPRAAHWSSHMSMGTPATAHLSGSFRSRTLSASTITSAGPASPYASNQSFPNVANTEYAPRSPLYFADQSSFYPKGLVSQAPFDASFVDPNSQFLQAPQSTQLMNHFNIGDSAPDFSHSAHHSMSSHNGSPATPLSGYGGDNMEVRQYNLAQNDMNRQVNPNVQLYRTESQAYQDELYNPPTTQYLANDSTNSRRSNGHLSPHHRLINERLQTANNARSNSPTSAATRDRSPFRDGSPHAPSGGWRSNAGMTAASLRQQQKEEAEQAEYAQHRPQLNREPTQTISPKEAMLDYNEPEQSSLFQDSIPMGYERHNGGTQQWPSNLPFGTLQTNGQGYSGPGAFDFTSLPQGNQVNNAAYQTNSYAAPNTSSYLPTSDPNALPPFPTLNSMESSTSDKSMHEHDNSVSIQRPVDTRANTGTYTCTYHGCTQRFDSQPNLQRHKRDVHRSQMHRRETSNVSSGAASAAESDVHSTASPGSSNSSPPADDEGLTSAAIMERNSQAGPHKCTRINPSTGRPCNTIFSRPYDLTRHEESIHTQGKRPRVRCHLCQEEKTFSRNDALTRHMRVVHPQVDSQGKRGRRQ